MPRRSPPLTLTACIVFHVYTDKVQASVLARLEVEQGSICHPPLRKRRSAKNSGTARSHLEQLAILDIGNDTPANGSTGLAQPPQRQGINLVNRSSNRKLVHRIDAGSHNIARNVRDMSDVHSTTFSLDHSGWFQTPSGSTFSGRLRKATVAARLIKAPKHGRRSYKSGLTCFIIHWMGGRDSGFVRGTSLQRVSRLNLIP
ncbi:hypothetical protein [Pseudomonas sp. FP1740]|uniref:hypothetical protein n=1 Tax=Pseudomonas sp. FP1740 TaxID=2954078 RepID=UPI002734BE16|nr:hypothetical protein [Pseudomonas sp. FP1740]WLG43189.1 hypothetical protein PSH69_20245 [Pseudomonas sp. FP1740]